MREGCSCMRICGTDSLVNQVSPKKCFFRKKICCELRAEYVTEKLSMCCYNKDGQMTSDVKHVVMNVSRILRRGIGSVKVIGSREVGGVDEPSNVVNSGECTEEVQHVFGSICVADLIRDCCQSRSRWRSIL